MSYLKPCVVRYFIFVVIVVKFIQGRLK